MHCASGKWIFLCLDRFEDSAKQALQPGKSHLSGFSLVCLVRLCIAATELVFGMEYRGALGTYLVGWLERRHSRSRGQGTCAAFHRYECVGGELRIG